MKWNFYPIILCYWYEQLLSCAITFASRIKTEWISSFWVKVIFISETTQVKKAVNCVKQLKMWASIFLMKKKTDFNGSMKNIFEDHQMTASFVHLHTVTGFHLGGQCSFNTRSVRCIYLEEIKKEGENETRGD